MKVSASILAINHEDILSQIKSKSENFDMLHIDIADNIFCPTYGISYETLKKVGIETDFFIDTHFMISNPLQIINYIDEFRIDNLSLHCEAISPNDLIKFNNNRYTLGIGILHETDISILDPYLELVDSVLLLCVNPGYSYQEPAVLPLDRATEFKNRYPDYAGDIVVDGGVSSNMLDDLDRLGVTIAVQGGAIFGSG